MHSISRFIPILETLYAADVMRESVMCEARLVIAMNALGLEEGASMRRGRKFCAVRAVPVRLMLITRAKSVSSMTLCGREPSGR